MLRLHTLTNPTGSITHDLCLPSMSAHTTTTARHASHARMSDMIPSIERKGLHVVDEKQDGPARLAHHCSDITRGELRRQGFRDEELQVEWS